MVNNSTNITKTNNHLSPQLFEHKQNQPRYSTSSIITRTITKTCFSFLYVSPMSTPLISSSSHIHIKSVNGRLFFIKAWTLRNRFVILLNTFVFNDYNLWLSSQGLAVIFSHHKVCIKKKKGGHFLGGQK